MLVSFHLTSIFAIDGRCKTKRQLFITENDKYSKTHRSEFTEDHFC